MIKSTNAVLFRMVFPDHICASGVKAKALLESEGYALEDRILADREAADRFRQTHGVTTTPQIWIEGEHIGGYEGLRKYPGKENERADSGSYQPVIAIFSVAALMAIALAYSVYGTVQPVQAFKWFMAVSVTFLAIQKLQDIEKFSTMFRRYDLLAQRWGFYGKIYPWLEAIGGILMLSGILTIMAAPIMLFIGFVGGVSVFKAVYIDRRDLKCACVGGDSNVPLGFVSLTENVMMFVIGIWMFAEFMQLVG